MSHAKKKIPFSPFYDQADTHLYSDWLLPYVFVENFGIPDRREMYLGGFPDPRPLLTRKNGKVKVHPTSFGDLNLSAFGKQLQKLCKGHAVYDLGCGHPDLSVAPRLMAQYLGTESYTGVDLLHVHDEIREDEYPELGSFQSTFVKSDIFHFLRNMPIPHDPKGFMIFGLEWLNDAKRSEFLPQLESEILRLCQNGDWVLLGAGGFDWELPRRNFRLVYSDPVHALYVRSTSLLQLIFHK